MFVRRGLHYVQLIKQTTRKLSTQPAPKKLNLAQFYAIVGLAGLGIPVWYYNSSSVLNHGKDCPKVFDSEGWVDLRLASFEALSQNTKKVRFEFDDKNAISGLPIASAVLASFRHEGQENNIIRPYTPTSDEYAKGYLDFVIKVYPGGLMSSHIHSMKVGQRLSLKGPIPKYPWEANKHNHICLIAGGTGITPMYQLVRKILKNPEDKTKVTLVFGNNTENDILLKKELQNLENTYPDRFRACYVLSNPSESWTGNKGHITKEILQDLLPDSRQENIKLFVCGPPNFYKTISGPKAGPNDQGKLSGILKDLGYRQDQVFKF